MTLGRRAAVSTAQTNDYGVPLALSTIPLTPLMMLFGLTTVSSALVTPCFSYHSHLIGASVSPVIRLYVTGILLAVTSVLGQSLSHGLCRVLGARNALTLKSLITATGYAIIGITKQYWVYVASRVFICLFGPTFAIVDDILTHAATNTHVAAGGSPPPRPAMTGAPQPANPRRLYRGGIAAVNPQHLAPHLSSIFCIEDDTQGARTIAQLVATVGTVVGLVTGGLVWPHTSMPVLSSAAMIAHMAVAALSVQLRLPAGSTDMLPLHAAFALWDFADEDTSVAITEYPTPQEEPAEERTPVFMADLSAQYLRWVTPSVQPRTPARRTAPVRRGGPRIRAFNVLMSSHRVVLLLTSTLLRHLALISASLRLAAFCASSSFLYAALLAVPVLVPQGLVAALHVRLQWPAVAGVAMLAVAGVVPGAAGAGLVLAVVAVLDVMTRICETAALKELVDVHWGEKPAAKHRLAALSVAESALATTAHVLGAAMGPLGTKINPALWTVLAAGACTAASVNLHVERTLRKAVSSKRLVQAPM